MSIFRCGQINLIIKWWDGCAGHMLTYLGRTLEPSSSHHSAWVMKRQAQSDSLTVIISTRQNYWSGLPFPSPRESSWPRDRTRVSRISGRLFTLWATRETLDITKYRLYVYMCVCACVYKTPLFCKPSPKEMPSLPCVFGTAFLFLYFG